MQSDAMIFIVDDEEVVRDALGLLVKSVGLQSTGFSTAQEFLDKYKPVEMGCLVLDVRMPGMSGIELLEKLQTLKNNLPTIVMTGHGDVKMAVRAMKIGALDFVEKPFNDQAMLDSIQHALQHCAETYNHHAEQALFEQRMTKLTPREREVMQLVVQGMLNKIIADQLGLSTRTVEIHRARIMEKMEAKSISELVRMVMKSEAKNNQ